MERYEVIGRLRDIRMVAESGTPHCMVRALKLVDVLIIDLEGDGASHKPRHRVPSSLERMPGAKR